MTLKKLGLAALLPLVFLLSAGTEALAGVEDVWNASPPTHDTVWAQERMAQVKPGETTTGRVGNWRSHSPRGSFTATKDGYLTAKSCHNCAVSIFAGGAERCHVAARDKYGQGRVSCNSIIQKGESYSISGAESASWRDME